MKIDISEISKDINAKYIEINPIMVASLVVNLVGKSG